MADILDRLRKAAGDLDAHARHVFGDTQNYASLDNVACYEHEKTCWDAYAEIERLQQARHAAECNLEAAHATVVRMREALNWLRHWRTKDPESIDHEIDAALAGGAEQCGLTTNGVVCTKSIDHTDAHGAAVPASERRDDAEAMCRLLASIWFYGNWRWETPNERDLQAILERRGWWPITEDALIAKARATDQPSEGAKP